MSQPISLNSQNRYEIKIQGQMDDSWLNWLGDEKAQVEITNDDCCVTTFSDIATDQAGLVGIIRRLHGLGLVLISVQQIEKNDPK